MMRCYGKLWPEHRLIFHVPFQATPGSSTAECVYRRTPSSIRGTVLTLLEPFSDAQWVYWCSDDKYPIALDCGLLNTLLQRLQTKAPDWLGGVAVCRARKWLNGHGLATNTLGLYKVRKMRNVGMMLERKNYAQIWLHQFLRAGVLRFLFQRFPEEVGVAKNLDEMKWNIPLPPGSRWYVTHQNHAVFRESSSRGKITRNCADSMKHFQISDSGLPVSPEEIPPIGSMEPHHPSWQERFSLLAGISL